MDDKAVIILGAGGHAKVLLDILLSKYVKVIGFLEKDISVAKQKCVYDIPILGDEENIRHYNRETIELVNGIGSVGVGTLRRTVYEKFKRHGYHFRQVIHPSAIVSDRVFLGEGVQVMAGAVINIGCRIEEDAIVNTRVSVDHDCYIGRHVHIAPGSVLSGEVTVGEESLVGVGSSVRQGLVIGRRVLIGAGSNVICNVPDDRVGFGNPLRLQE